VAGGEPLRPHAHRLPGRLVADGLRRWPAGRGQQQWNYGWGTKEQILDPRYATAEFLRHAEAIEHRYSDPGDLAQAVQRSGHPERYAQRAAQTAALNDKFCG
jgi:hypothetical protein